VCVDILTTLGEYLENNATYEEITSWAIGICIKYHLMDDYVCTLGVYEWAPEVLTIAVHSPSEPSNICTDFIGVCNDPSKPRPWNVTFPSIPKPTPKPVPDPQPSSPVWKVLHISDTHFDENYTVGYNTDCGEPLCCRPPNGEGQPGSQAGEWGDGACDPPKNLFQSMLLDASTKDLEFVLWTGDVPPHNVWQQTRARNSERLHESVSLVSSILGDVPVYPTLGNHESAPVNSNPTPEIESIVHQSNQWLLDSAADAWKIWLPEDALNTIRKGGFYQVRHGTGLRVISLNMNYCNSGNWWLLLNNTDPAGQLQWLVSVLQDCENTGDKAYLIGHIPPGDCLPEFGWNLYAIVNRYESSIAGTFWGHTHRDELQIFYDTTNITRAISVAYIGPSLTPYGDNNPGYKVYEIDGGDTKQVLNHRNYWANLTEANLVNKPTWLELYNAKDEYRMSNLLPQSWDAVLDLFLQDDSIFQDYWDFRVRLGSESDCTGSCKDNTICSIQSARDGDHDFCTKTPQAKQIPLHQSRQ